MISMVERIQDLCSSKDTTLIGLEREIGLGRGTIRNWDKNSPSVDKVQKVADYFNVSTDYLLYGFERNTLAQFVNSIRDGRSFEKFANDTGVDIDVLDNICLALVFEPPSLETLEKIAASNPIDFIIDRLLLLKTGGYHKIADIEDNFKDTPFEDNDLVTADSLQVNTLAAHKTDGYDDDLTDEEQRAVRAFIETYRKQFPLKDKND